MQYRKELERILKKCTEIKKEGFYIWGAGNTTDLNWNTIEKEKLIPAAFIDSIKTGQFHSIEIISPNEVSNREVDIVLISSAVPEKNQEIIEQIQAIDPTLKYHSIDEIILGRHIDEILDNMIC